MPFLMQTAFQPPFSSASHTSAAQPAVPEHVLPRDSWPGRFKVTASSPNRHWRQDGYVRQQQLLAGLANVHRFECDIPTLLTLTQAADKQVDVMIIDAIHAGLVCAALLAPAAMHWQRGHG